MPATETAKQDWVDEYASRILQFWQSQEGPLGVDTNYTHQLRAQLDDFYDDPLKRSLIETSY
ncbi:MAG: hypothetical protein KAR47_01830 [Planctomycetes bacterium]|nr:hypothetical protein [Planctomycetota bacterium]